MLEAVSIECDPDATPYAEDAASRPRDGRAPAIVSPFAGSNAFGRRAAPGRRTLAALDENVRPQA